MPATPWGFAAMYCKNGCLCRAGTAYEHALDGPREPAGMLSRDAVQGVGEGGGGGGAGGHIASHVLSAMLRSAGCSNKASSHSLLEVSAQLPPCIWKSVPLQRRRHG